MKTPRGEQIHPPIMKGDLLLLPITTIRTAPIRRHPITTAPIHNLPVITRPIILPLRDLITTTIHLPRVQVVVIIQRPHVQVAAIIPLLPVLQEAVLVPDQMVGVAAAEKESNSISSL